MTREEVLQIVKQKTLQILDECPPENFDEKKTLLELGANSLDMVEILSACSRELKIKIPRAKYTDIKNIEHFVNVLWEFKNQPPSSVSP